MKRSSTNSLFQSLESRLFLAVDLVSDINTTGSESTSAPIELTAVNGTTYFALEDGVHGRELWGTDGTPAGTVLLQDAIPGPGSSNPVAIAPLGDRLIFSSTDGNGDVVLSVSDGTVAGTSALQTLSTNTKPKSLGVVASKMLLVVTDPSGTKQLWQTDGTPSGTIQRTDLGIFLGTPPVLPLGVSSTAIYLSSGGSVYRTNLVAGGTTNLGSANFPNADPPLATYNNGLYSAINGSLFRIDLTTNAISYPGNVTGVITQLRTFSGKLYIATTSGAQTDAELWVTQGTEASTVRVKDLNPGFNGSFPFIVGQSTTHLYFTAELPGVGAELYRTDGTSAGTVLVSDINPGGASSFVSNLQPVAGQFVFTAVDATGRRRLYQLNPSNQSVTLFTAATLGTTGLAQPTDAPIVASGGQVLFVYNNGADGPELFRTDGTASGTYMVRALVPGTAGSSPRELRVAGGKTYFQADDGVSGVELYVTDGTSLGTTRVSDIVPGAGSSNPAEFAAAGTKVVFTAESPATGNELWVTDGTSAGTVLLKDIVPGTGSSYPSDLTSINGEVYFVAITGTSGFEVWKTDGTSAGTVLLKGGSAIQGGGGFALVNGKVLFNGYSAASGQELWVTDGTSAGTTVLKDIFPGTASSSPNARTVVGSNLFFFADDGTNGNELWKSDGTAAGTVLVRNIRAGATSSANVGGRSVSMGNEAYFFLDDPTMANFELWKSDGTSGGTVRVAAVGNSTYSAAPHDLVATADRVYFVPSDTQSLWQSDGTTAGTTELTSSGTPFNPRLLTPVGDFVYFQGTDDNGGSELLWRTDGTVAGTVLIRNLNPASGPPQLLTNLVNQDGTLLFVANDGLVGYEIWREIPTDIAGPITLAASAPQTFAGPSVKITFNEDVGSTLTESDLVITNRQTGEGIPTANLFLSYNPASKTADVFFGGYGRSTPPDGNYRAVLGAGRVSDGAGNASAAATTVDFFVFRGDANGDRAITSADFNILVAQFGQGGKTFAEGDFNYDTKVDTVDFNLLLSRFGTTLPAPAPGVLPLAMPAPRVAVLPGFGSEDDSLPPDDSVLV